MSRLKMPHIIRNVFRKYHPWLNVYIWMNIWKKEQKAYLCQPHTKKTKKNTSYIHIFFSYFLPPRMSELVVKLLIIIDWKWNWLSKIIWEQVNLPSLLTAGRVISFSNLKGWFQVSLCTTNRSIKYQSFVCSQLNGFKYSKWLNSSMWSTDGTLTDTNTSSQSGSGSNGN